MYIFLYIFYLFLYIIPHILIVGFLFSLRSARPPHDLLLHCFLLPPCLPICMMMMMMMMM